MATIKLPENLCKGVKIRAGYYTGSGRHAKAIDTTAEEWAAECLRQMGKLGAIIRAVGSCGRFYVRPEYVPTAEANGLSLDIYDVEAMFGGTITNYEITTNS